MEQLLPDPGPVDPAAAHAAAARPAPMGRPWVLVNMVASADGATAVDGVSGPLGGPADKVVFSAIRAVADVILVAAGTVRAEAYGPPRTSPERQAERRARGQAPFPRLAIVSGRLDLDPAAPVFAEAPEPPLVYAPAAAPADRRAALADVAEVVVVPSIAPSGEAQADPVAAAPLDLAAILEDLGRRGAQVVLAEGGPSLNGQLVAAGVVDELDLTLAPQLVAGSSARLAHGSVAAPTDLRLAHLWRADDDTLFLRYVRA